MAYTQGAAGRLCFGALRSRGIVIGLASFVKAFFESSKIDLPILAW